MPKKNLTAAFVEKVKATGNQTDYFDTSLPGFSLRVNAKGKKTWCLSYRFSGKWTRYTFGQFPIMMLAEAREFAADSLREVAHGTNPGDKKKEERQADTFDYLASEYIERHAKVKKKSWHEDQRIIDTDLMPIFGGIKAKDLTRRDVRAFLDRKAKTAPIMANRIRATLRKMYNWGIINEIVEDNPVLLVPLPAKDRQRDRILTEDEIKKVWQALNKEGDGLKSHRKRQRITAGSLKLRLITAQRGGEVMGMEWSEIDGEWWTIPGTKTKNGLAHRVPLTPLALRILDEIKKEVEGTGGKKKPLSQFVFPGPSGKAPMANPQKALERIQTATGIHFRGHDLRRTAASLMTGMGTSRLTVSKILNHVEPGVTAVYDRHSYDKEKREALEAWSRQLTIMVSDLKEVRTEA
jgi:integrase